MRKVLFNGSEYDVLHNYYLDGLDSDSDDLRCSFTIWETADGKAYIENRIWLNGEVEDITPYGSIEVRAMFKSLRNAIAKAAEIVLEAYPGSMVLSDARGARAVMAETFGMGGPR